MNYRYPFVVITDNGAKRDSLGLEAFSTLEEAKYFCRRRPSEVTFVCRVLFDTGIETEEAFEEFFASEHNNG